MLRTILAVIAGMLIAGTLVGIMEEVGHNIFPIVGEFPSMDATAEEMRAYHDAQPAGALVWVIFGHLLGVMLGAATAVLINKGTSIRPAIIIGAIFTLVGIGLFFIIHPPLWMGITDILIYLPSAYVGGLIAGRLKG